MQSLRKFKINKPQPNRSVSTRGSIFCFLIVWHLNLESTCQPAFHFQAFMSSHVHDGTWSSYIVLLQVFNRLRHVSFLRSWHGTCLETRHWAMQIYEHCLATADRRKQSWLIFIARRVKGYSSNAWYAQEVSFEEPMGRKSLQALWQNYKVDLAFYGSVHNYEGTSYVWGMCATLLVSPLVFFHSYLSVITRELFPLNEVAPFLPLFVAEHMHVLGKIPLYRTA